MTNEEKAIEIARKHHAYCFSDAVSGAIDMAELKDQQFNKVCNWLRETNIDGLCDSKNITSKFIKKLYELYNGS